MKVILSLIIALLVYTNALAATQDDLYSAEVFVDITADNAATAQNKAMQEANKNAIIAVAKKTTTDEGVTKFETLNNNQISNFIQETSVLEEKSSNTRYIAKLRIIINKDLFQKYMSEQNIPLAISSSINVVIIPIFKDSQVSSTILFESNNPWANAWENKTVKYGLNKFNSVSPTDSLSTTGALALDGITIDHLFNKYQTPEIYVTQATKIDDNNLEVIIISSQTGEKKTIHINSEDAYNQALKDVVRTISANVKQNNISSAMQKNDISVLYNYETMRDWVELEKYLKNLSSVSELNVDAMGSGKVQFHMTIVGSMENLTNALELKKLGLQNQGSLYILQKIGESNERENQPQLD